MADYFQGDIIRDYFSELDINSTPITGDTFVTDNTEDPDGDTFALTVVEVDTGVYRVEFQADKAGTYYYQIHGNSVPNQYFEETFVVSSLLSSALVSIGTAAYGTTLLQLIRDVAGELRDFRFVRATANGATDGTSYVDNIRLAAIPSAAMKGAVFFTTTYGSPNFWKEARVSAFNEVGQVLTLQPPLSFQTLIGDEGFITNLRSQGYTKDDYIDAINRAMRSAFINHAIPISYTYPNPFIAADGTITTPTHMTHLSRVETVDEAGIPLTIPMNPMNKPCYGGWCNGWYYDDTQNSIVVRGRYGTYLEGKGIRLLGYGRDKELTEWDDLTSIHPEWIVYTAAASLKRGNRDKQLLADASMIANEADKQFPAAITILAPGTIRIR